MRLSFTDEGKGPVLVFIHSYLFDKKIWRNQIEFFKKDFRCISIELPGHGESNNFFVDEEIFLKTIAKEIADTLDKLEISRYTCIGASLGGILIPYIYQLNKDKINSIALINTDFGNILEEIKDLFFKFFEIVEKEECIPDGMLNEVISLFIPQITYKNMDFYETFKNKLENLTKDQIKILIKIGRAILEKEEDILKIISDIDIPICFINGENNLLYPYYKIEKVYVNIKNAELYKIESTNELFNKDDSDKINKILNKFLGIK